MESRHFPRIRWKIDFLGSKEFSVTGVEEPFNYVDSKLCEDLSYGDNWLVECVNEKSEFMEGDNIYFHCELNDIVVDHRYRLEVFRNGINTWSVTTDWYRVDKRWTWDKSYMADHETSAAVGEYQFKFYADDGSGLIHRKTAYATVLPKNLQAENPAKPQSVAYRVVNLGGNKHSNINEETEQTKELKLNPPPSPKSDSGGGGGGCFLKLLSF